MAKKARTKPKTAEAVGASIVEVPQPNKVRKPRRIIRIELDCGHFMTIDTVQNCVYCTHGTEPKEPGE